VRFHKRIPTDQQILEAIDREYYAVFASYSEDAPNRGTKVYVPIDIEKIARGLGVDGDIVFGRLYFHLERKYGYQQKDGADVHFFVLRVAGDIHCVNFPLMASVLADLQDQSRKHDVAIWIAVGSLLVSVASVLISILLKR